MSDKLYRDDLIRAAMAAQSYTNGTLAKVASLDPSTISAIRNGSPNVTLPTLKAATDALGLDWWSQVFTQTPVNAHEQTQHFEEVSRCKPESVMR